MRRRCVPPAEAGCTRVPRLLRRSRLEGALVDFFFDSSLCFGFFPLAALLNPKETGL